MIPFKDFKIKNTLLTIDMNSKKKKFLEKSEMSIKNCTIALIQVHQSSFTLTLSHKTKDSELSNGVKSTHKNKSQLTIN